MEVNHELQSRLDAVGRTAPGGFTDPEARTALQQLTRYLYSLPPESTSTLIGLIEQNRAELARSPAANAICRAACEALFARPSPDVVHLLGELLLDPDAVSLHEDIAEGLGEMEDPLAERYLVPALGHAELWVRAKAAESLGALDCRNARDAIAERLRNDSSPEVRRMAADALGLFGDDPSLDALLDAIQHEQEIDVRVGIVEALGLIDNPRALEALQQIAREDKNEELRDAASEILDDSD